MKNKNALVNKYLGLLYLFGRTGSDDYGQSLDIFRNYLGIDSKDEEEIVQALFEKDDLVKVGSKYFLNKREKAKKQFIILLENKLNLDDIYKILPNGYSKPFLKQILEIDKKSVSNFYNNLTNDLLILVNDSKGNDDIYVQLDLLGEYIYRVPDKALNIIKSILYNQRVSESSGGISRNYLARKCVALLGKIRYLKPKGVLSLLIKSLSYSDQAVQSKAKETLKNMLEYNLFVLKKIGYQPQLFLLKEIEKWGVKRLLNLFDLVIMITRGFLSPTYEGHEMTDYKTMTLHSGILPVDENLKDIRERTIEILKKLYLHTKELKHKKSIIQALHEATITPYKDPYDKDMKDMLLSNTNVLIDYYISIVPEAENEIIKIIEKKIHFIRKHRKGKYPRMKELLTLIDSNTEYQMFSIFIGYDYGYGVTEDLDRNKAEDDRRTKIQEFIDEISGKDYKSWEVKILSVIKNYPKVDDKGEYRYFNHFLNELAKQKPEIACKLIKNKEAVLEPFLFYLLVGIWESKSKERARSIISEWICKGKHLSHCTRIFEYVKDIDKSIIDTIFRKAKKEKNTDVLNNIIGVIDKNYPKNKSTTTLFVGIVKELTKHSNCMWVKYIWHPKDSVLKSLTKAEYNIILNNLLLAPSIDYSVEQVLAPIAEKYPKQVINFLQKRVLAQLKRNQDDRYESVPYEFVEVNVTLRNNAKVVVPEILKWYSGKDRKSSWMGGSLLHKIFPSFNDILEKELIKLVKVKNNKKAETVFDILIHYEGEEFLHNVCKTLIKTYPKNDEYNSDLIKILSQMGIVSGEYGFVEGYKKKKDEIQSWKKDKNRAIQSFVKKYEDFLDKRISFEQKHADEELELRKREFVS